MYNIRITNNDLTGFDRNGQLRVAFGKGMTQFTAPTIQLGPDDPGRVFCGNEQMNPLGRHIPSTIVSPQPTWVPTVPQVSVVFAIIFTIMAMAEQTDDNLKSSGTIFKSINHEPLQIINFEDFLPEN